MTEPLSVSSSVSLEEPVRGVHGRLIDAIRKAADQEGGDLVSRFRDLTDEQMLRIMFVNYRRGDGGRGLRLTNFGLQIMRRWYRGFEVQMPQGCTLKSSHLLYLDSRATMPYHCSAGGFVIFERDLGIMLTLADGRVEVLMEIEGVTPSSKTS